MTIENLTIENAVAQGGSGGEGAAGGGGGAGLGGGLFVADNPAGGAGPANVTLETFSSPATRRSAALAGQPGTSAVWRRGRSGRLRRKRL